MKLKVVILPLASQKANTCMLRKALKSLTETEVITNLPVKLLSNYHFGKRLQTIFTVNSGVML